MGSHEDSSALTIGVMEDLDDLFSVAQVEVPSRLVREDDVGFCDERAGESNTLLLASGKRAAQATLVSSEADLIQVLVHFLADDPFAHASDSQRQLHVFIHLSLIHISEPTRLGMISYAVFCLKKQK